MSMDGRISRRAFLAGLAALAAARIEASVGKDGTEAAYVLTVTGKASPESLGIVLPHEHVLVDFIGAEQIRRDRYDQDEAFDTILPHLTQVRKLGCGALVECTPAWLGRDPALLQRLSKASGLRILTNTGFYGAADGKFLPRFVRTETAEQLAARWANEFKFGIEGTGIRPGFIKISVNSPMSETDAKLARAAGLAHLATGLTIASHTTSGAAARQEIGILKELGVDPSAFIWVHAHAEGDAADHVWAAKEGAWVSFDGIAPAAVDHHVKLVKQMIDAGQLDRVLVSHDAGWYNVGQPEGGTFRAFDTLFTEFLPKLKAAGVDEARARQLVTTNPQRAFSIHVRAGKSDE